MRLFVLSFIVCYSIALSGRGQTLDVSAYTFANDEIYPLSAPWEFYWDELLQPSDFSPSAARKFTTLKVPGGWEKQFPALGKATYRITLKTGNVSGLALYFPTINSSAKVWVNGELATETGRVTADKETYVAKLASTLVDLPKAHEIEIIIQVANFTEDGGGFAKTPQLGKISSIASHLGRKHGIENFFAGSLIAMFIYMILLFFLYQNGMPFLWLALICLGVALRSLILHGGSFLLPNLFPFVSWEVWKKMEFGTVYVLCSFFPLYIYNLFKTTSPLWPIRIFVVVSTGLCVCVLVTPLYFYSRLLEISHISFVLGFIYAIYSVTKAWRAGATEAKIIFTGVMASFPFILMEILKNSIFTEVPIQFKYLVELGVLVFLLFQVYLLSSQFAKSYKNLEVLNLNLEQMVAERSGQLITANRVKDQLLSVVSHDIKSPLNSLRGLLKLFNSGNISPEEFTTFSKHIEGDLGKTGLLVDNILYWTASQLKRLEVNPEKFDLNGLIQQNVELFSTIASNKGITLKASNERHTVFFDRNILDLTLRNLLANAIKFSYSKSEIIIQSLKREDSSVLRVIDFGVGMSQELMEALQHRDATGSHAGTSNEKGTGLGLSFSIDFLKKAGGQLQIESVEKQGSTFTIIIPA